MLQVLLIEPDFNIRTILKLNILKTLGCDVIEMETSEDAVAYMESNPDISLVYCSSLRHGDPIIDEINQFLVINQSKIPFIIRGIFLTNYESAIILNVDTNWSEIILKIGDRLGLKITLSDIRFNEPFMPISTLVFLSVDSKQLLADIYIRIKKNDTFAFLKRINKGDFFERLDIERYIRGGLKDFYIHKDHFSDLVDAVTKLMITKLRTNELKSDVRIQLTNDSFAIVQERINNLLIDETTKAIIDESMKSINKMTAEKNAIADFLKMLNSDQLSYAFSHTYLASILLHKVSPHFDWDSVIIKEKLTALAFFHDISLKESRLMQINSQKDLDESDLTPAEKINVLNHANASAIILDSYKELPNGISAIVREHHASKSGIGFTDNLSIAIAPIAMMFVVIENFIDKFMKLPQPVSKQQIDDIFIHLESTYTKVTYKQTVVALMAIVKGKDFFL